MRFRSCSWPPPPPLRLQELRAEHEYSSPRAAFRRVQRRPGQTMNVQVYLAQTNGSTGTFVFHRAVGGRRVPELRARPCDIASTSSITPNSAFNGPDNTGSSQPRGTTSLSEQTGAARRCSHRRPTPRNAAVLLGTFTFTGASAARDHLTA